MKEDSTSLMSPQHRLDRPVREGDHVLGSSSAQVELVQYGDYQCPYTARTVPIVAEILERKGDGLRFAFRYFPLNDIHPYAQHAAEAAEAAAAQGKFWEMHETLFSKWNRLDDPHLVQFAERVGLDMDRFFREMEAHDHADRVRQDFESGERSGVESTPTFYVNGIRYDGPNEVEPLLSVLEG